MMLNNTPGSAAIILKRYLEELEQQQLKEFKFSLQFYQVKRPYSRIPRARLENADNMKIADEMIFHYQEEYALNIAENIFRQINRQDLLKKFSLDCQNYWDKKKVPERTELLRDQLGKSRAGQAGFKSNQMKVDLSNKTQSDSEWKELWQRLKDPGCTINKLLLKNCSLTTSHCADLSAALRGNTSLNELDLSSNSLGDWGVKQLCEGLKHPGCEIQRLVLDGCSLGQHSCTALAPVLTTSKFLRDLDLSHNTLWDSGLKDLCEGLKHPSCKLKALFMIDCSFTRSCCADLSSALKTNTSLTHLYLNWSRLEDSGVRELCEGLKRSPCKIQTLSLLHTELTDACTEALCSALSAKETLQYLDLSENYFTKRSDPDFSPFKEAGRIWGLE